MFSAKNLLYGVVRFFHKDDVENDDKETPEDIEKCLEELSIPITTLRIDPITMSPEDATKLARLLQTCIKQKKFLLQKGLNIINTEGENKQRIYLHLEHALLYRICESNPGDYRFEVLGKEIGSGAFSHVYLSAGTVVPQPNDGLIFKAPRDDNNEPVNAIRIIKHQLHKHPKFPPQKAVNEVRLGKLTPYLGGKIITLLDTDPIESFLVENILPGEDLLSMLIHEREKKHLPPEEREELALEVLHAIREQIHLRGILHRDIKPDNMLVFKDKDKFIVYVIDLGLSKLINEPDEKEILGTVGYTAPEIFAQTGANEKCDVFGAGIVESLIWGAGTPPIIQALNGKKLDVERARKSAEKYQFPDLFKNIEGFDSDKTEITAWLYKMINKNPEERLSLDSAIAELEKIVFARRLKAIDESLRDDFTKAHEAGLILRTRLEKEPGDIARVLQTALNDVVSKTWSPAIYAEFTRLLRVRALYGVGDKAGINKKIDEIITQYHHACEQLQARQDKIAGLYTSRDPTEALKFTADRVLASCHYIRAKCTASRLGLDEMVVLTHKMNKRLPKVDGVIALLDDGLNKRPKSPTSGCG